METGTRYQFVPYRNTGMQDLMAGLIDLMIDPAARTPRRKTRRHHKGLRGHQQYPHAGGADVPTVDAAGLPALQITSWHGLWVPKARRRTSSPSSMGRSWMRLPFPPSSAASPIQLTRPYRANKQTPAALAAWQKAEIEKWWPIIKAAGIKAE